MITSNNNDFIIDDEVFDPGYSEGYFYDWDDFHAKYNLPIQAESKAMFTRNQIAEMLCRQFNADSYVTKHLVKWYLKMNEQKFIALSEASGIHLDPVIKNRYFIK